MASEIDIKFRKAATNAIFDHLIEDLQIERLELDEDFYWDCPAKQLYVDPTNMPIELVLGYLRDDVDFVKLVRRGESADVTYNLVHIAPLLRYIAEKVKS